jgi:hypothetical protein
MRTLASLAAAAVLVASVSACSKSEPAPDAAESETATAEAPVAAAPATGPAAGTYDVVNADGSANATVEIREDRGYTRTPAKGLAESGIVKMEGGKTCFDPSGDAAATCYTDSAPDAAGIFTATMDDGTVLTITPKK